MLRTKRTQVLKNYLVTLLDESEYDLKNHGDQGGCHSPSADNTLRVSLRSKRLEVVGARKNGRAREEDTREGRGSTRVSPSCAPVLSCAHYFQAPAKQATSDFSIILQIIRTPNTIIVAVVLNLAKTYNNNTVKGLNPGVISKVG